MTMITTFFIISQWNEDKWGKQYVYSPTIIQDMHMQRNVNVSSIRKVTL